MPGRVVWSIAAPMIGLGAFLLGLGVFAALNVQEQQQTSSELVIREVRGMLAIEELYIAMREIRYQLNIFLRTKSPQHLAAIPKLHDDADQLLAQAKEHARTDREQELIGVVEEGYRGFFDEYLRLSATFPTDPRTSADGAAKRPPPAKIGLTAAQSDELSRLSDDVLTNRVLLPLRECLKVNQQIVEKTNEASQATAQHLKIGFLLLGVCGGLAGLLLGTAIARAVGRSIVQLNVSVRSVAAKLLDVTSPVTFSHTGDLAGIEAGVRKLEDDIATVVERLQQRETEVLRTEQLARVGQLAAGIAHELRNPLMPMKMLVQAAIARGDGTGLKGRSLQVLNDEIVRLESAIQAFLDFARPPVPEKTSVDLAEVMRGTLDLVAARAKQQKVEIRPQWPPERVVAYADQTQIRQLLLNLLLNALDALPDGGQIDAAIVSRASLPAAILPQPAETAAAGEPELDPSRPYLAVRISDSGSGIPEDLLSHIFDPFVTTKESGTGLGLSICQRIAAAHGGCLLAANRPAGGAEFTLLLPYDN